MNLATGEGYSVLEVIQKAESVSGNKINYDLIGRRPGDPDTVLATSNKALALLKWKPEYSDLETLIRSAWEVYK